MRELVISIRRARPCDARGLAAVQDAAWRAAYQGILPGVALERMISRKGPRWWRDFTQDDGRASARRVLVLVIGERVSGYVVYGPNRNLSLPQRGEVDALYLAPVCHGLGLGRKMFRAARNDLASHDRSSTTVWCLDDNWRGRKFFAAMGGAPGQRSFLRIGGVAFARTAYAFS